jgi:N-acetylglucosamine kinase-like BadF-type ATPase
MGTFKAINVRIAGHQHKNTSKSSVVENARMTQNQAPLVELPPALTGAKTAADGSQPARAGAAMGASARYVMGIDGGATKTLAAVLDLESHALHLAHGGPSNEDAVGAKAAVDALLGVAEQAIERAEIGRDELAAAVIAVAGTDTGAIAKQVGAARSEDWIVVNDVVGAWAAATGAEPGIGAISGTGSNVFGVGRPDGPDGWLGRPWRAGGWGHLLGDEGSGYWLGIQSIKAALRDREASGPATALSHAAVEFFDAPSVEALAAHVYAKPLTKSEIAAFATETSKVAERGDAVARELYARGARELGEQIAAVIHQTGLSGVFPVGLIGSAFKAGAVFVEPLTRAVHEHAPEARVAVVEMAPVGGSLLLAMRACDRGDTLSPAELSRLIDDALA